jgi:hypothetical protein
MTRNATLALAAALGLIAAGLADEPRQYFELILPDFSDRPFPAGNTTIDLPDRPIRNLSVLVLNAAERNISYGNIFVTVNGKGLGNAFDRKGTDRGILLQMTAFNLGMRPDELFDPRENAIEAVAQDKRGRRYYQNWVLRVSGAGQNQLFTYTSTLSPDDSKGVPPDLIVTEPASPPVLHPTETSIKVRLKGTVTGAGTSVQLNGQPLVKPISGEVATFDEQVTAGRDRKQLVLEAIDKKGNRRSVAIPVIAQEKAPPRVRLAGKRYALVVGISRYGNQKGALPPLTAAAADAGQFAQQLQAKAGFPKENIRVLLDDQASIEQIRVAFSDFAAKAAAEDLLVIYVAAHGLHDPNHPDKLYLAPYGAQTGAISSTAIEFSDLKDLLDRNVHSNQTFLIFDAGHKLDPDLQFSGQNLINDYLLSLAQEGRGVLVSGAANQVSMDRAVSGQASGLFGYWLTEGIAGQADLNGDHVVTGEELFRFVAEKVRVESQGQQTPRFRLASSSAGAPLGARM